MKFDFDTFEFAGLIAPGSVIVLAAALLRPALLREGDTTVTIALGIAAAYILGHLVAALANVLKRVFTLGGVHELDDSSVNDWIKKRLMADDQFDRLASLGTVKLHRKNLFQKSDEPVGKIATKQMYLAVMLSERPQRLTTFDGLYNLSRGLTVSFLICIPLAVGAREQGVGLLCAAGAGLAFYRTTKFKDLYSRELVQQFLMLEETSSNETHCHRDSR